jgi:hypothetical protein
VAVCAVRGRGGGVTNGVTPLYRVTTRNHARGVGVASQLPSHRHLEDVSCLAHGVNTCHTCALWDKSNGWNGTSMHVPLVPPLFVLALAIAGHNRAKGPDSARCLLPREIR